VIVTMRVFSVLSDTPIASASRRIACQGTIGPRLCRVRVGREHDHVVEVPRIGDVAASSIQEMVEVFQRQIREKWRQGEPLRTIRPERRGHRGAFACHIRL
jgi:hypothetical protein